jgi:hypothetical protein
MDGTAVVVAGQYVPARIARPPTWRHWWPASAHAAPRVGASVGLGGRRGGQGFGKQESARTCGPLAKASLARLAAGPLGFRANPVITESET